MQKENIRYKKSLNLNEITGGDTYKKKILNEIFRHYNTLKPIKYWMQKRKFKNLIYVLYEDHMNKNSTCCICKTSFCNNLVRDSHLNLVYEIEVFYSCEECKENNIEDDAYFGDIYQYFSHINQYHDN